MPSLWMAVPYALPFTHAPLPVLRRLYSCTPAGNETLLPALQRSLRVYLPFADIALAKGTEDTYGSISVDATSVCHHRPDPSQGPTSKLVITWPHTDDALAQKVLTIVDDIIQLM